MPTAAWPQTGWCYATTLVEPGRPAAPTADAVADPAGEGWLTTAEVARRLGVDMSTVRELVAVGRLRAYVPGKRAWRFRPADVDAYLNDIPLDKE